MNQTDLHASGDDHLAARSGAGHWNAQERDRLLAVYRDGLLNDTLPFWLDRSIDRQHGGFLLMRDRDGSLLDTDKGVWQQGRFTWMLGELCNQVERRPEWLEAALHGGRFLQEHCFDPADGRMWFHVTREGQPIRKRRYAYSESFASIAFGELAQASGEGRWAELADGTLRRFLDHHRHSPEARSKFTSTRPTRGIGIPMITIATAQQLRESIGLPDANALIDQSIDAIRRYHVKEDIQCVMETVGPEGELLDHFDGRTLNPGHAMEAAWFILLEGKLRDDRSLVELGCKMLDWMWHRGWDPHYGGILYFVDVRGLPVQEYWHDMKFWWPHNEALIATLLAYQLTGNPRYASWHTEVHKWAYEHFSDREHGEWFGYLHRDGQLSVPLKGNLWKGPFHLPRMQLVCWKLLEEMQQDAAR